MALDPRFRFENFVVGSANQLAVSAAKAVAQSPGAAYNPLFIYSSSGLGKTHLLLAIGHLARELAPQLSVEYSTADEFVQELNGAIISGATEAFKERFQNVGLLLLDDVQFLAGHRETQSEMLRLFNVLQRSGHQIVLTSDRPPAEIADLDERLITRLSGGLVVDVGTPDYETRVAILRAKCEERGVQFEPGVLEEVARIDVKNVRELQGALNRLIARRALGPRVTARNVHELLGDGSTLFVPAGVSSNGGEFASFLSDVTEVVAQHLDAWRVRVVDAMMHWRQLGYDTAMLERALEKGEELDVDALFKRYEDSVARLRSLAEEAAKFDVQLASSKLFHDPERVGEAELVVARLAGTAEPAPAPRAELARADFEVGPSNQLAVHAADAIVDEPGRKYNPLFVYGSAGVGKTHLLHALGNQLIAMSGGASAVACVNARQFMDELIAALREGTIERWRARYCAVDALIMDDVHLCAGTERTQEELFHVFNALYAGGRQVVLSADRAPKDIEGLEDRLRSRFEGGLVVEIQPPDRVLRERLYARWLTAANARHDRPLLEYLASRPAVSVLEVAAVTRRLVQAAEVVRVPLSVAFAKKELEGSASGPVAVNASTGGDADEFFLDDEKIVWDWPDVAGRVIEEFR